VKVQCLACDAINSPRARFCRKCGERLSERQPTSIRRVADEPEFARSDPELGWSGASRVQSPAHRVNLAAPLTMVVLLFVAYKAYLELVERTVPAYVGLLAVDALIFALFALPARRSLRELLVPSGVQSSWLMAAVLGGLLIALCQFAADRFVHWLGVPLDPGPLIWFEERGAPAWLAVLCGLVFGPLIYVIGWQGYFQMELSRLVTPLQASLITAVVSAASDMYPQRLPFDFIVTLALCELRRKSSSLIPCLVASSLAGALEAFVFNPGR
jgi:hypothetical protein